MDVNQQIEKKLIEIIDKIMMMLNSSLKLTDGITFERIHKELDSIEDSFRKDKGRGFLFEEVYNSLYEIDTDQTHVSIEHLLHLRKCLSYEEDYVIIEEIQQNGFGDEKYQPLVKLFINFLNSKRNNPEKLKTAKKQLSNEVPIEKYFIHGLELIDMDKSTRYEIDFNRNYVKQIIEIIKGTKSYNQLVICSIEGFTYSNIIID